MTWSIIFFLWWKPLLAQRRRWINGTIAGYLWLLFENHRLIRGKMSSLSFSPFSSWYFHVRFSAKLRFQIFHFFFTLVPISIGAFNIISRFWVFSVLCRRRISLYFCDGESTWYWKLENNFLACCIIYRALYLFFGSRFQLIVTGLWQEWCKCSDLCYNYFILIRDCYTSCLFIIIMVKERTQS